MNCLTLINVQISLPKPLNCCLACYIISDTVLAEASTSSLYVSKFFTDDEKMILREYQLVKTLMKTTTGLNFRLHNFQRFPQGVYHSDPLDLACLHTVRVHATGILDSGFWKPATKIPGATYEINERTPRIVWSC